MGEETTPKDEQRPEAEHLAWIAKAQAVIEHIVTTSFRPQTQDQADDTSGGELRRGALLRA
jgi:hypothetical protein